MKVSSTIVAFMACIPIVLGRPISRANEIPLVVRDESVSVSTGLGVDSGPGVSGSATVDTNVEGTVVNPDGSTGSINGGSSLAASLDPGSRTASNTIGAVIAPGTAGTESESAVQNDGNGSVQAGGHINAVDGDAFSGAGSGVGSSPTGGTGGGAGGGSNTSSTGAGGGVGASVVSSNGDASSGIVTGAGPDGSFVDAIANAISEDAGAFSGTDAADFLNDIFSESGAGTFGAGSTSGAGSGAGDPNNNGVDTGVNSSS